jgi:LuxR family maltose regulon positive regulatory protein
VAEPSLFSEPFTLVGAPLLPLLHLHLRRGTAYPEFVVRVQRRLEQPAQLPVNEWGDVLTDRERKILRYLATNLSNSEISQAEFVSVNTVKTHIAHVYRKLGVTSRREAVRRASELGLV